MSLMFNVSILQLSSQEDTLVDNNDNIDLDDITDQVAPAPALKSLVSLVDDMKFDADAEGIPFSMRRANTRAKIRSIETGLEDNTRVIGTSNTKDKNRLKNAPEYVYSPTDPYRKYWDACALFFMLVHALWIPFAAAYAGNVAASSDKYASIVSIYFRSHLILNFLS